MGRDETCPVCGKLFYMEHPDFWVYREFADEDNATRRGAYLCSYGCMRKVQTARDQPPGEITKQQLADIRADRVDGMRYSDIAKKWGLPVKTVKQFTSDIPGTQTGSKFTTDSVPDEALDITQRTPQPPTAASPEPPPPAPEIPVTVEAETTDDLTRLALRLMELGANPALLLRALTDCGLKLAVTRKEKTP